MESTDEKAKIHRAYARAKRALEGAMQRAACIADRHDRMQVENRLEEITFQQGYASTRDGSTDLVVTGNWNEITRYETVMGRRILSDLPKRLGNIFEKLGFECEWSDEWSTCDECYKLIRTSPDSYSWQLDAWFGDGFIRCAACVVSDPQEYLDACEEEGICISIADIDPTEHGYKKYNAEHYESGWHPGQTDDPRKVAEELGKLGITRFVFKKAEQSQFYSCWDVYVHTDEDEEGEEASDAST